jgi:hypothetical protein
VSAPLSLLMGLVWTPFWLTVFPFCTLLSILWPLLVDPRLISSNIVSQECHTIMVMVIQKASADCQTLAFVLFCELFWNLFCKNFIKVKSSVNDRWPELWLMCQWWVSLSVLTHLHGMD